MVNSMPSKKRVVIVSGDSSTSLHVSKLHADGATELTTIDLAKQNLEDAADSWGTKPIDMLIFADDMTISDSVSGFDRSQMQDALYSLTYAPFRFATLLRPALAAAQGCVVLCSRTSASMERDPQDGRSVDRPFRAAAHALWKCLQVEWQGDNVQFFIIASDGPPNVENIASAMAFSQHRIAQKSGSLLVDGDGVPLPW